VGCGTTTSEGRVGEREGVGEMERAIKIERDTPYGKFARMGMGYETTKRGGTRRGRGRRKER